LKFASTRGRAPAVGLGVAIAAGLAPDAGLYVPESMPNLPLSDFDGCESLAAIASRLLSPFFAGDRLAPALSEICTEAFDFPVPLKRLQGADTFLLELFHGPTAAFKDIGARFLAACLKRLRFDDAKPTTILVATSGDTGAAVAAAFHGLPDLRVVVLYPDGRVSPRQAHQLGCFGANVTAVRVAGTFDDCQALVKRALNDDELQATVRISSANSISLGRLLPQMCYYAQASLEHWRVRGQRLNFVVPTGNLGNAVAAAWAREVGMPIGDIALATNANAVLSDFFAGGEYAPRASLSTLANAMDVGSPSNFERLRWLFPDAADLRGKFAAISVPDDEIRATIRDRQQRWGEILCPHTATAASALARLRANGAEGSWAIVATAHPAKFELVVEPLAGAAIPVPPALAAMLARPARAEVMAADYDAFRRRLARR